MQTKDNIFSQNLYGPPVTLLFIKVIPIPKLSLGLLQLLLLFWLHIKIAYLELIGSFYNR